MEHILGFWLALPSVKTPVRLIAVLRFECSERYDCYSELVCDLRVLRGLRFPFWKFENNSDAFDESQCRGSEWYPARFPENLCGCSVMIPEEKQISHSSLVNGIKETRCWDCNSSRFRKEERWESVICTNYAVILSYPVPSTLDVFIQIYAVHTTIKEKWRHWGDGDFLHGVNTES